MTDKNQDDAKTSSQRIQEMIQTVANKLDPNGEVPRAALAELQEIYEVFLRTIIRDSKSSAIQNGNDNFVEAEDVLNALEKWKTDLK